MGRRKNKIGHEKIVEEGWREEERKKRRRKRQRRRKGKEKRGD